MPSNHPEIFDKADWLKEEKNFEAEYYDLEKNIFIEAPLHPEASGMINNPTIENILIGKYTYKLPTGMISPNVIIGRYSSIAHFVSIGATHHHMDYLSTGGINLISNYYKNESTQKEETKDNPYTIIGCDVWIGINALILGGAKIGHGACIGAGAVVKKEIPPYTIAVGNPARVIKSRFSDEIIADLLELKWWNLETERLNMLPYKNIKECITILKDIRKNK